MDDFEDKPSVARRALVAAWRTVVQLFYIVIVLWVFSTVDTAAGRFQAALAGLIYCTIRSGFIGLAMSQIRAMTALGYGIDKVRAASDDTFRPEYLDRPGLLDNQVFKHTVPIYFHSVGIGIIYLICLINLFGAIDGYSI